MAVGYELVPESRWTFKEDLSDLSNAVLGEDDTVVFLKTKEGFEPQPVSLGRPGETHIEILDGISAGDQFVSQGGFTLKAELGKDAFGDGHGH